MKREYKFRAWDGKKMIYIGDDRNDTYIMFMEGIWFVYDTFSGEHLLLASSENDNEIMQYTGLKDKNGKEIYEGDIHGFKTKIDDKTTWCYLPVVFDNGAFWLDESFLKDRSMLTLLCEYKDEPLNIVANIYQDKHLLK